MFAADTKESEEMPLCYFEKSEAVYRMFLHAVHDPERAVLLTPGSGVFALECIAARTPVLMLVSSKQHEELLGDLLKASLKARVMNKNDKRFHRALSMEQSVPETEPEAATGLRGSPNPGAVSQVVPRKTEALPEAETAVQTPEKKIKVREPEKPRKSRIDEDDNPLEPEESSSSEESSNASTKKLGE